jgi:hypothetical protein
MQINKQDVKAILIPSKIEAPLIKNKPTHSI